MALASSLKCDPDLIFEFVYNNIRYEPLYGSNKGALGTLLDRQGDDADQAILLVNLWSAAGFSASGYYNLVYCATYAQMASIFGVQNDSAAIDSLLAAGGIPYAPGSGTCPTTSVEFPHFVAALSIGDLWYFFDPSAKTLSVSTGLTNLSSALGYSRSQFLADIGGTTDSLSISNVSRVSLRADLTTYANNLVAYIDGANRAWSVGDVVGGSTILPLQGSPIRVHYSGYTPSSAFPSTCPNQTPTTTDCRTYVIITMPGATASQAIKFYADQIYAHRITISSVPSGSNFVPTLLIDGAAPACVGSGTCTNVGPATAAGTTWSIATAVTEPNQPTSSACPSGVTATACKTLTIGAGGFYLLSTGFGHVGRGTAEYHRQLMSQARAGGNAAGSEVVLGEGLAAIGYNWLAQNAAEQEITDQLAKTTALYHFAIGIVGQSKIQSTSYQGPYVDLPLNYEAFEAQSSTGPSTTVGAYSYPTAFLSSTLTASSSGSAFESGVLLQTQAPVSGMTAASTMVLADDNMNASYSGASQTTYFADGTTCAGQSAFVSTIEPAINPASGGTYSTADYNNIVAAVMAGSANCPGTAPTGEQVLIPKNGALSVGVWAGAGYMTVAPQSGAIEIKNLITGGMAGGFSGADVSLPADNIQITLVPPANSETLSALINSTPSPQNPSVAEPVDGISGAYVYQHDDLITGHGSFPYALPFSRTYLSSSGSYLTTTTADVGMGNGWSNSFVATAQVQSDPYIAMGASDSPAVSSVNAIAALYVMQDLSSVTPTAQTLTVTSMVARWLADQTVGNTVLVTQPSTTEEFVALPHSDAATTIAYNPPPGSTAQVTQLAAGQFSYLRKDGVKLNFGPTPSGALQGWTFPNGMSVNLSYNGSSQLTTVTNNLGRGLTLAYSGADVSTVTDDTGRVVSYGYDANHNLTAFTDPLGFITTFAYDASGTYDTAAHLTQVFYPTTPANAFVTNWYDPLGRVAGQANASGDQTSFYFAGSRTEVIDPASDHSVTYQTDRGKVILDAAVLNYGALSQGDVFNDTVQQNGVVNITTHQYDGIDRLTLTTLPEGGTTAYSYITAVNPWANNIGTIVQTAKPGSSLSALTTSLVYDPIYNKPTRVTDPLGLVATLTYDPGTGNLLQSVADAGGGHFNATSRFTYNAYGQVLTATDPLGTVTLTAYDDHGDPTSVTHDSGRLNITTRFAYSPQGDVVSLTDPNGNITTSAYDLDRRLTGVTLPVTAAAAGPLLTSYVYDANGQLLSTRQSTGGTLLRATSATYSLTGKTATATDANGNVTRFSYDTVDRLAGIVDPVGNTTTYGYDALSRKVSVSNPAIQSGPLTQMAYAPDGPLASLTIARSNTVADTTSYAYDGFDRLATATYPDASTDKVTAYDADGNALTRQTRAGAVITLTYDTLNRLSTKAAPSEATVTYAYDLDGRPTGFSDTSAAIAAPAASASYVASYVYDAVNRPITVIWTPAATQTTPSSSSGVTFAHAYDANNRRIGQTASDNSWWSYPAATAVNLTYTANNLNQYSAVGSVTPTYDGNGNLTYDGTLTYSYDAESRLTQITQGSTTLGAYAYDAQGRRKSKTAGGATTLYVTDADNRPVLEYDGTTGALEAWYAFGGGGVLNRMNVAAASRQTTIPDIQGSIIGTLDSGGTLSKDGYQPFGENPTTTTGSYRYTGQRIDPETGGSPSQPSGLYDYRARIYSPTWGRFLQADPIGYAGGANMYAYVGNDPLDLTDPAGEIGSCSGSQCASIPAALAMIQTAANSTTLNPYQQIALSRASTFLNGPNINVAFVLPCDHCAGGTTADPSNGTATVSILPSAVTNPDGSIDTGTLAEILTHEGAGHGFDELELGLSRPATITQETWTETNAYTIQQTFDQAIDRTSYTTDLWQQGWSLPSNQSSATVGLNAGIAASVNNWVTNSLADGYSPPPVNTQGGK